MWWRTVLVLLLIYSSSSFGGTDVVGYVKLNGETLEIDNWTKSGDYFDANYTFFDGEPLDFSCHNSFSDQVVKIYISSNVYEFSNKAMSMVAIKQNDSLNMFIKLTKETDGLYVKCNISNYHNINKWSVYRIYFIYSTEKIGSGFQINEKYALRTTCESKDYESCFMYKYYDTETVSIRYKGKYSFENLTCKHKKGNQPNFETIDGEYDNFTYKIIKNEADIIYLECEFYKNRTLLTFVPNMAANFHPVIKPIGKFSLLMEKTLAMFYYNKMTLTILYDYSNEPLKLMCASETESPEWEGCKKEDCKNGKVIKDIDARYPPHECRPNNKLICNSFILISNDTWADITCTANDTQKVQKKIKLVLIRRKFPDLPTDEFEAEPTTTTSGPVQSSTPYSGPDVIETLTTQDATEIAANTPENFEEPYQEFSYMMPMIGGGVAVLVLILIAGCFLFKLLKKKPKSDSDSNINYESLPEHKKGAMPVPRQWQEAQYAAPVDRIASNDYAVPYKPSLDEMYAKPVPKNQRNGLVNDNLAYASIDDLNQTYAKAVPKHLRNNNTTGKDVTYTQLAPKPRVANKPKVLPIENPYAEIQCSGNSYIVGNSSESPYAEVNFNENPYAEPNVQPSVGYVNVFDNQRYVNSNAKNNDYAEPAYCELSKVHK